MNTPYTPQYFTAATVNRDLNELQKQGLIKRSYGGAELVTRQYVPVPYRYGKEKSEKISMAKAAARLISDGDTVFIDGATTTQYMARYITDRKNLTVITNNMALASYLSRYSIRVICLGGEVSEVPSILNGTETVDNAASYKADKMFFSTGGFFENGEIVSTLYRLLHKTMMRNSKEIYYLADHDKVNSGETEILCDLGKINGIITGYDFPEKTKKKYKGTKFIKIEQK